VALLDCVAAGACYYALTVEPAGPWDDAALAGIAAMCLVTITVAVLSLALTIAAVAKRVLPPWWLAPAVALLVTAAVRWALLAGQYPEG
jgi:hypothetical protein